MNYRICRTDEKHQKVLIFIVVVEIYRHHKISFKDSKKFHFLALQTA